MKTSYDVKFERILERLLKEVVLQRRRHQNDQEYI